MQRRADRRGHRQVTENNREANVAVERIDYQCGGVKAKGALVWNEKISGKRPLLLVMPNWLGVTEPAIKRAQKMAGDKYVALVADMYGEGKTCEGPPTSQEWMMAVRADQVEEGRGRVLLRRRQRAGVGAERRRRQRRCFAAWRPADHHAGQEGRYQSRGVRDPRLEGPGGA